MRSNYAKLPIFVALRCRFRCPPFSSERHPRRALQNDFSWVVTGWLASVREEAAGRPPRNVNALSSVIALRLSDGLRLPTGESDLEDPGSNLCGRPTARSARRRPRVFQLIASRIGASPSQKSQTAEISQSLRNVHIPASSSAVGSLAAAVLLRGASPRSQVTKWSGRQTAQAEAGGVLI